MYKKLKGKPGIPNLITHGKVDGYNYMVLEYLGPSVGMLFKHHGKTFELPTLSELGVRLLQILRSLYEQNVVHCDLKPENIVVGNKNSAEIYLLDFGLANILPDADELQVPFKLNSVIGSLQYISTGGHQGIISFKNDIESLAYVLIHLMKGELPWDLNFLKTLPSPHNITSIFQAVSQRSKHQGID